MTKICNQINWQQQYIYEKLIVKASYGLGGLTPDEPWAILQGSLFLCIKIPERMKRENTQENAITALIGRSKLHV